MRPIIGKGCRAPMAAEKGGGGGAPPPPPPRSTGDRSPRGRIAGVDAGPYLFGDTQSVNDSSP